MFHGKRSAPGAQLRALARGGLRGALPGPAPGRVREQPGLALWTCREHWLSHRQPAPCRSPLAQSHWHLGRLRLAGGEKPSPTPAFCAETERCSLRATQPGQTAAGCPKEPGLCPSAPATLPTVPLAQPPCPRYCPRRRLLTSSRQLPGEVLARFPRHALLNPKGTGPWKTPFSSLSEAGSFRLGLYLVPLAGNQVLGLALVEASFRFLFLAIWGLPDSDGIKWA